MVISNHPFPLQEFCPEQLCSLVWHALWPLQELTPWHSPRSVALFPSGEAESVPQADDINIPLRAAPSSSFVFVSMAQTDKKGEIGQYFFVFDAKEAIFAFFAALQYRSNCRFCEQASVQKNNRNKYENNFRGP
ncbi:MAG: hypothetical protein KDK33_14090 [Leptospiraceae bacterium]|nr:hypothetical protein [Leptospiraceae bacterium]